jgi:hypothetical protein
MIRVIKNLFHRPAIKMGRVDNSRIHTTRLRNAQFVSFITESGSLQPFSTDRYDARLRRRKMIKALLATGAAAGAAWVLLESAHALTMF